LIILTFLGDSRMPPAARVRPRTARCFRSAGKFPFSARAAIATLCLLAMGASSPALAVTLTANPACSGNSLSLNVGGDGPFQFNWFQGPIPYSGTAFSGFLFSSDPTTYRQVTITELSGDGESLNVGDWSCPTSAPLNVGRTCVGNDLQLTVGAGDGPFSVGGNGPGLPVGNFDPTVTLTGPGAWTNVYVSEGSGDFETVYQGNWICPMTALSATPTCVGNDLHLSLSGDGTMEIQGAGPGFPAGNQSLSHGPGTLILPGPGYWANLKVLEQVSDRETVDLGSIGCGGPFPLVTSVTCSGEHLYVSVSGDGPFDYQWTFPGSPPYTASIYGSTLFYGPTPGGPNSWINLTITEATGDRESRNLGTFTCPDLSTPTPTPTATGTPAPTMTPPGAPTETPTPIVTATTAATPSPVATATTSSGLDHFVCYQSHRRPVNRRGMSANDAVGESTITVRQARRLCAPVDQNGEDPTAPDHAAHLTFYTIEQTSPRFTGVKQVTVGDAFGTITVDLVRAERLLVPTATSVTPPPAPLAPSVDAFKCYRVRGARVRVPNVTVRTPFDPATPLEVSIKRPRNLCLPVDANGEGILDPTRALMCYEVRAARQHVPHVYTTDQFGTDDYALFGIRDLCVPLTAGPGALR
jgi:hypothetical protein